MPLARFCRIFIQSENHLLPESLGFPCDLAGNECACNVGDLRLILGLGRSPGERKDYPL